MGGGIGGARSPSRAVELILEKRAKISSNDGRAVGFLPPRAPLPGQPPLHMLTLPSGGRADCLS